MVLKITIFVHIIAATIWTGGHLILASRYLPRALRKNDFQIIKGFESQFEPIGLPALLILVVTGIYMATQYVPDFFEFNIKSHYTRHLFFKFVLLSATFILALHARLVLIPKKALKPLAIHIIVVTLLSVLFVFVGFSIRTGGLL